MSVESYSRNTLVNGLISCVKSPWRPTHVLLLQPLLSSSPEDREEKISQICSVFGTLTVPLSQNIDGNEIEIKWKHIDHFYKNATIPTNSAVYLAKSIYSDRLVRCHGRSLSELITRVCGYGVSAVVLKSLEV